MIRNNWVVATELSGKPREFEVILYSTLKEMRVAATEFQDSGEGHFREAGAVAQYRRKTKNGEPEIVVRFVVGHLQPELVSHEIAHVAQLLYGLDMVKRRDRAYAHFEIDNEGFAYLLGTLFGKIWNTLEMYR